MDTKSYKTTYANKETIQRNWYVIDAEGEIVGRLATRIAHVLRGKHRADFTPHFDNGDYVIVLNADKVRFTGNKRMDKVYLTYSGYPGGQKSTNADTMLEKHPMRVLEKAVRGMLPKTKLGKAQLKKLFLYEGNEHPHTAQKPEPFKF